MSLGQGNISFTNKPAAAAASVAGARNGLSIDALLNAVLGQDVGEVGDPGALISNREIPMGAFSFAMKDAIGNEQFLIDPDNGVYVLGDYDYFKPVLEMGWNGGVSPFQEMYLSDSIMNNYIDDFRRFQSGEPKHSMTVVSTAGEMYSENKGGDYSIRTNSGTAFLLIDQVTNLFEFGDNDNNNNGTHISIDDALQTLTVSAEIIKDAGSNFISLDHIAKLYKIGDLSANGWNFIIDDTAAKAVIVGDGDKWMNIEPGAQIQFGDIDSGVNQNLALRILPATEMRLGGSANGNHGLLLHFANREYQLGPTNGNSTRIIVEDNAQQIALQTGAGGALAFVFNDTTSSVSLDNAAHNAKFKINGIDGFTGVVNNPTQISVVGGIVTGVV